MVFKFQTEYSHQILFDANNTNSTVVQYKIQILYIIFKNLKTPNGT